MAPMPPPTSNLTGADPTDLPFQPGNTDTSASGGDGDGGSSGAVIGGVVAALVVVAVAIAAAVMFLRRRRLEERGAGEFPTAVPNAVYTAPVADGGESGESGGSGDAFATRPLQRVTGSVHAKPVQVSAT